MLSVLVSWGVWLDVQVFFCGGAAGVCDFVVGEFVVEFCWSLLVVDLLLVFVPVQCPWTVCVRV
jgi:hypothetical protein